MTDTTQDARNEWKIKYDAKIAAQAEAMKALSHEQLNAIKAAYKAMDELNDYFVETYDVTGEQMRNLMTAMHKLGDACNLGGE